MRAKEYLELNKDTIKYYDDIKRIIRDLLPLRRNKIATDTYYNEVLSADIRRQSYLLQKDLYDKNNSMQQEEPVLAEYDDEIPFEKASDIRNELFHVIESDKSFGYIFYLLGTEQNAKHFSEPIDCIPNKQIIEHTISANRDDYPKSSLDEYLDDEFNYQQYNELTSKYFEDDQTQLLNFFNHVYELFDEIRCRKHKISEIRNFCNTLAFNSDKDKYFEISFVIKLIDSFESGCKQLERCKIELSKLIADLKEQFNNESDVTSKINLSPTKGMKVNFIRVINVLTEMGFFIDENGNKSSKKDVFATFGQSINKDLSTFQNDLSTTKSISNSDMKSLTKIFEEMLDKQRQIITDQK